MSTEIEENEMAMVACIDANGGMKLLMPDLPDDHPMGRAATYMLACFIRFSSDAAFVEEQMDYVATTYAELKQEEAPQ